MFCERLIEVHAKGFSGNYVRLFETTVPLLGCYLGVGRYVYEYFFYLTLDTIRLFKVLVPPTSEWAV